MTVEQQASATGESTTPGRLDRPGIRELIDREQNGEDVCDIEHQWPGTAPGEFFGIPGHGKQVSFRRLHVFDVRDGLISRGNVWLDGGIVVAQLTS